MGLLQWLLVLLVPATHFGLWSWGARLSVGPVRAQTFPCMSWSPHHQRGSEGPRGAWQPTVSQIDADMAQLARITRCVRV
jgi:hypothetical protein